MKIRNGVVSTAAIFLVASATAYANGWDVLLPVPNPIVQHVPKLWEQFKKDDDSFRLDTTGHPRQMRRMNKEKMLPQADDERTDRAPPSPKETPPKPQKSEVGDKARKAPELTAADPEMEQSEIDPEAIELLFERYRRAQRGELLIDDLLSSENLDLELFESVPNINLHGLPSETLPRDVLGAEWLEQPLVYSDPPFSDFHSESDLWPQSDYLEREPLNGQEVETLSNTNNVDAPTVPGGKRRWQSKKDPVLGVDHASYPDAGSFLDAIKDLFGGAADAPPSPKRFFENQVKHLQERLSDSYSETRRLQEWLNGFGSGLNIDGDFGPKTFAASVHVLKGFPKPAVECLVGVGLGGAVGLLPGGFIITPSLEMSGALESAPRTSAICYGAAETAVGVAEIAAGVGTIGGGSLMCASGAGCVVGAPASAAGLAQIAEGAADVSAGLYVTMSAAQRPPDSGGDRGARKEHGAIREGERGGQVWSAEEVARDPDDIFYQPEDGRWIYIRSNGDNSNTVYIYQERVFDGVDLDKPVTVMDKLTDKQLQSRLDSGRWGIDPVSDP